MRHLYPEESVGLEPNNRSILQDDFSGSISNERSVNTSSHLYISRREHLFENEVYALNFNKFNCFIMLHERARMAKFIRNKLGNGEE